MNTLIKKTQMYNIPIVMILIINVCTRTRGTILGDYVLENNRNQSTMYINNNSYASLSEYAFHFSDSTNNTNLLLLDASHNSIQVLPDKLFAPLRALRQLHLQYNRIQTISSRVFARNLDLEIIDLHRNRLDSIDFRFGSLPKLQTLNLAQNTEFDDFKEDAFRAYLRRPRHGNASRTLNLTGVRLRCGCDLSWLSEVAVKPTVLVDTSCGQGNEMKGVRVECFFVYAARKYTVVSERCKKRMLSYMEGCIEG